jgi:hypothetical protein
MQALRALTVRWTANETYRSRRAGNRSSRDTTGARTGARITQRRTHSYTGREAVVASRVSVSPSRSSVLDSRAGRYTGGVPADRSRARWESIPRAPDSLLHECCWAQEQVEETRDRYREALEVRRNRVLDALAAGYRKADVARALGVSRARLDQITRSQAA